MARQVLVFASVIVLVPLAAKAQVQTAPPATRNLQSGMSAARNATDRVANISPAHVRTISSMPRSWISCGQTMFACSATARDGPSQIQMRGTMRIGPLGLSPVNALRISGSSRKRSRAPT